MTAVLQIKHESDHQTPSFPPERRNPDPPDLRRRTTQGRRVAETCLERARWLPDADRAALTAVFRDGLSVKELQALHGTPTRSVHTLRQRIKRTAARLLSPRCAFVTTFLEPADQAERLRLGLPCWPARRRAVAEHCIIRGLSIRATADALDTTFHVVRCELNIIHTLHEAAIARPA